MKNAFRLGTIAARLDDMGRLPARDLFFALAKRIDPAAALNGFDDYYDRKES